MATPSASAACASLVVSTVSGSFTHRNMPPGGALNSAAVPNCSASASISVVELGAQAAVERRHVR